MSLYNVQSLIVISVKLPADPLSRHSINLFKQMTVSFLTESQLQVAMVSCQVFVNNVQFVAYNIATLLWKKASDMYP